MNRRRRIASRLATLGPVAGLLIAGALAACSAPEDAEGTDSALSNFPTTPGFLNGWQNAEGSTLKEVATNWYSLPQGSQLINMDVFMTLQMKDGTKFSAPENLKKFGFLYAEDSPVEEFSKKTGLPLGFVHDLRSQFAHKPAMPAKAAEAKNAKTGYAGDMAPGDYLGITCAACHTGVVKVAKGDTVEQRFVHGGQSMIDFESFTNELYKVVKETAADSSRKSAFLKSLPAQKDGRSAEALFNEALARVKDLETRSTATPGTESGPGRLDAVAHILNEVIGHQMRDSKSIAEINVPVSLPPVWNAARLECVQTNCLSANSLTRNVGEVFGVFGDSQTYVDKDGRLRVESTAKVKNLYDLEMALDWVESPKWDAKFFGKELAEESVLKAGKAIFKETCAGCHAEPYDHKFDDQWNASRDENWNGGGADESKLKENFTKERYKGKDRWVWKVKKVPFGEVGTDPAFIVNHAAKRFTSTDIDPNADFTVNADGTIAGAFGSDGAAQAIRLVNEAVGDAVVAKTGMMIGEVLRQPKKGTEITGGIAAFEDALFGGRALRDLEILKQIVHPLDPLGLDLKLADGSHLNLRKSQKSMMTLIALGGATSSSVATYFLDQTGMTDEEKVDMRDKFQFNRAPAPPTIHSLASYRARPLNGVFATAPYFHNGSVPTLRAVLSPTPCAKASDADQKAGNCRPEKFTVGHGFFDAKNVGVDIAKEAEVTKSPNANAPGVGKVIDTSVPGNLSTGHTYGADLNQKEKDALLEYLKSI